MGQVLEQSLQAHGSVPRRAERRSQRRAEEAGKYNYILTVNLLLDSLPFDQCSELHGGEAVPDGGRLLRLDGNAEGARVPLRAVPDAEADRRQAGPLSRHSLGFL